MEKPAKETQYVCPRCQVAANDELKENDKLFKDNVLEPENAKLWFNRATILGSMGYMREAIEALSRAIALDPKCGIFYRWRGHRHLNCGDIPDAAADFTIASHLIPDNWDVWYHLGLCNTVLGRREAALYAHKKCLEMTKADSKLIAITNWMWINLSLMGRRAEADALLKNIKGDMEAGPDGAYLNMCLVYKGELEAEKLLKAADDDEEPVLTVMTQAFGLANYYLVNGNPDKYLETIDFIVENGKEKAWNCFGYSSACYVKRTYGTGTPEEKV